MNCAVDLKEGPKKLFWMFRSKIFDLAQSSWDAMFFLIGTTLARLGTE